MKNFLLLIAAFAVLAGCSVTSEKYKYQQRFDHFYNLLNADEKKAFSENDTNLAGTSLDKRLSQDKKLAASWLAVQTEEAINTFDGIQSVAYFRGIILRELNREPFYSFMDKLDAKTQYNFANKKDPAKLAEELVSNRDVIRIFDLVRTEYRLYGFSNAQIIDFFRNVSFPEVSRRELYPVLKLLKDNQAFADFRSGNTESASQKMEQAMTKNVSAKYDFEAIRKRAGLTKTDLRAFLDIYYNVIMKEMDAGAVERTLGKF